jgi:hypothetical protein
MPLELLRFHTLTLTLSLKGEGILFLADCGARALFDVSARRLSSPLLRGSQNPATARRFF